MESANSPVTSFPSVRPLIGREREQVALGALLSRTVEGAGGLVLISGEAGIGKTTLVESACAAARRIGAIVLRGNCYDLTVSPPYGPWVEIANDYRPGDDWPELPAFIHNRGALEELGGQDALFLQSWEFYASLACIQPVVIALEDLQWSDEPSLELLRFVARHVSGHAILLLATYRDEDLSPDHPLFQLIPMLVRESRAVRLKLNRFDRIDTGDLIHKRYALENDDHERLLAYLQQRAEGNPFFIDELLRSLEDESILNLNQDRWMLGDLSRAPLPSLVRQVVESRMRKLSDDTRRMMALGSVIGESISLDLWRRVAEVSESELADYLRPAIEHHLLIEGTSPDRLRFSHALIRSALYEGIVLPQRRLWHRAVGEAMAGTTSPDPSLVADHFRRAGDRRAVEWLSRAGRRAQRLYAWRTAVERFEDALALMDGSKDDVRRRGWLCYRLGRVLCFRDPERSRIYLDEAVGLGGLIGDDLLSACAITERGHRYGLDGEYEQALSMMANGLEAFDRVLEQNRQPAEGQPAAQSLKRGMDELRGMRLLWLFAVATFDDALSEAEALLAKQSTPERSDLRNSASGTANLYTTIGCCYGSLGQVEKSQQAFTQARQLHRNPFALALIVDAEVEFLTFTYMADVPGLLEDQVRQATEYLIGAINAGIAVDGAFSTAQTLLSLARGTDWAATIEMLSHAKLVHPDALWRRQARVMLGRFARRQGNAEDAWGELQAVLPAGASVEPGSEHAFLVFGAVSLASELALDAGNSTVAHRWIETHDRWLRRYDRVRDHVNGHLLWARYHKLVDNRLRARYHADCALNLAESPRQALYLVSGHRLLAELELDSRQFAATEEHVNTALALADACKAPYERAITLLVKARLEASRGNVDDAGDLIDEVRSICIPLEAKPALSEADALEASLESDDSDHHASHTLTPRELDVLRLVARGLTDAEVAEQLFVSPRTVGSHLSSIYTKLDVRSRTEATRFAVEKDLV